MLELFVIVAGILTSLSLGGATSADAFGNDELVVLSPSWMTMTKLSFWLQPNTSSGWMSTRELQHAAWNSTTLVGEDFKEIHLEDIDKRAMSGYRIKPSQGVVFSTSGNSYCTQNQQLPTANPGRKFVLNMMKPRSFLRTILLVVGFENSTRLSIRAPQHSSKHASNRNVMQASLMMDEIVSYSSAHDLTGFTVDSDKPVAIFCQIEWRGKRESVETHISPQMPLLSWGCSYLDMVHSDSDSEWTYRITAATLPTTVQFWTRVRSGTLHMTYSPHSDVHVSSMDGYIFFRADRTIGVARVQQPPDSAPCPSASMRSVPPMNARSEYRIYSHQPSDIWLVSEKPETDYDIDGTNLQDSNISVEYFTAKASSGGTFAAVKIVLESGIHTLSSITSFSIIGDHVDLGVNNIEPGQCKPLDQKTSYTNEGVAPNKGPMVFRVETLREGGSRKEYLEPNHDDSGVGEDSVSSGPSIIAVVVSASMAVLLVGLCIGGFVLVDMWSRRQVIGRVSVAPFVDPF